MTARAGLDACRARGCADRALWLAVGETVRMDFSSLRVALVHDWLVTMRGGERVLHELASVFPNADLYTLVHAPGCASPLLESLPTRTSCIDSLPGGRRHFRKLLPILPWAVGRFRLAGYDLVLSSSHAVAKGVRVTDGACHVCYCHTPMRYVWDAVDTYVGRGLRRVLAEPLVRALRRWDVATSAPDRVHAFIANSQCVAERIRRHYGRSASVIFPPVDTDLFRPSGQPDDGYYLLVGAFVPYKREELAIEAFRALDRRLVIVGDGPSRRRLQRTAPPNVEFLGWMDHERLAGLYAGCRAVLHPQEEDAGIVPIEAQSAGRPVIAFGAGGALESVRPLGHPEGATGVLFDTADAAALRSAVLLLEQRIDEFRPEVLRAHAEGFSKDRFRAAIESEIRHALESHGRAAAGTIP